MKKHFLEDGGARVIPERGAWLWENGTAKAMVDRGLQQAQDGELGEGPGRCVASVEAGHAELDAEWESRVARDEVVAR